MLFWCVLDEHKIFLVFSSSVFEANTILCIETHPALQIYVNEILNALVAVYMCVMLLCTVFKVL